MTREEAIQIIKSECYVFNPFNFDCPRMINTALDMAIETLEQEPKTGHWIKHEHNGIGHIECSECLCWFLEAHLLHNSYCPNCGAKMEVEE